VRHDANFASKVGSSGTRLARAAPSNHALSVAGGEWQDVELFQWEDGENAQDLMKMHAAYYSNTIKANITA